MEDANGNRDTSASNLTVLYAINNLYFQGSGTIRRANLGDINEEGGYTIRVQSNLSDTLDASQIINHAISDWNCATLVNFTRGADTALTGAQVEGVNLISLSQGALPGGAKTTWSGGPGQITQCVGNQEVRVNEFDIEINPFLNWNFRDTFPTLQEKDFYTAILHELGHGHMIDHVLDPTGVAPL